LVASTFTGEKISVVSLLMLALVMLAFSADILSTLTVVVVKTNCDGGQLPAIEVVKDI